MLIKSVSVPRICESDTVGQLHPDVIYYAHNNLNHAPNKLAF